MYKGISFSLKREENSDTCDMRMNLTDIIPSEINYSSKDREFMILLLWGTSSNSQRKKVEWWRQGMGRCFMFIVLFWDEKSSGICLHYLANILTTALYTLKWLRWEFYHDLNNYVKTVCIEDRAFSSLMKYLFPLKRRCDRKPQIYILVKRNKEHFHQIQEHKAHSYDYY